MLLEMAYQTGPKIENFSRGHATNNKRAQTEKDHINRGPMENLAGSSLPQITNGPKQKKYQTRKENLYGQPNKVVVCHTF